MKNYRIVLIALFSIIILVVAHAARSSVKATQIEMFIAGIEDPNTYSPAAGGSVYVYSAGTLTNKTTWTDRNKTTPTTNPFTLDSMGRAQVYGDGIYKFVIKDSSGTTLYTLDNIGIGTTQGPWVDVSDYESLTAAVTAIGSVNKTTLLIASSTNITANTTVPSNISILMKSPGNIVKTGSYTLEIDGEFSAGLYQTLSGFNTTDVTFGSGAVHSVYAEWWGAKGDGVTDCTSAIQAALNSRGDNGLSFVLPMGTYLTTSPMVLHKKTTISGKGEISYSGTSDALQSTWAINSSTAVNISVRDILITSTNGLNAGAGFADVGGSYVHVDNVQVTGFKYGIIFDQTEISDIQKCVISGQSTGGIWLVNGADHTGGASKLYTNSIRIENNQINEAAGVYGVIDDGGGAHSYHGNSFNGGIEGLRVSQVYGLVVSGNEFESASDYDIDFFATSISGTATGMSQGVDIHSNDMVSPAGANINLDFVDGIDIHNNQFGQAVAAAIISKNSTSNVASGVSIYGNSKLVIGSAKTASPFIGGYQSVMNSISRDRQMANTYVSAPLSAGTVTVTPASMEGIAEGTKMIAMNDDGTGAEPIVVSSSTATTFVATFALDKTANFVLLGRSNTVASGSFMFVSGGSTTTVGNVNVSTSSNIVITPTNASAATLVGSAKAPYVSAIADATSFVVSLTTGTAIGGETFHYSINDR